jgi:hypothetical protein
MLVPLGRAAMTGAVADPALRPVVAELWSAFAGDLRYWALGLAVIALLVMATVAAMLEPARLHAAGEVGLRALTGRSASRSREVVRIASLLALGAFAIAFPLPTLSLLTVVAGGVLITVTMHALVALVAPNGEAMHADARPLRVAPALTLALGVIAAVSASFGAIALAPRLASSTVVATSGPVLECNGAEALCQRRLDDVTFAGAHNAMGAAVDPHWLFPNQDVAIPSLLALGVRALLIDVVHGHPVEDRI